jgi:hypothetical protein
MKTWLLILVLAAGTVLMKTLGPVLAGGRQPPAALTRVVAAVALWFRVPAVLAMLLAVIVCALLRFAT